MKKIKTTRERKEVLEKICDILEIAPNIIYEKSFDDEFFLFYDTHISYRKKDIDEVASYIYENDHIKNYCKNILDNLEDLSRGFAKIAVCHKCHLFIDLNVKKSIVNFYISSPLFAFLKEEMINIMRICCYANEMMIIPITTELSNEKRQTVIYSSFHLNDE